MIDFMFSYIQTKIGPHFLETKTFPGFVLPWEHLGLDKNAR